jgi:hypothetical protein
VSHVLFSAELYETSYALVVLVQCVGGPGRENHMIEFGDDMRIYIWFRRFRDGWAFSGGRHWRAADAKSLTEGREGEVMGGMGVMVLDSITGVGCI